jgi:hypothetical protein
MSDFWVSRYLFSLIKKEHQPLFIKVDDPNPTDEEEVQYFFRISSTEEEAHASGLESGQAKIFVIKSGSEYLYVGYASGCMFTRLSKGLADSLGNAYVKEGEFESDELNLFVFEFSLLADYSKTETRNHYQPIQAELIYLIKSQTGNWPILQKQIIISNENQEEAREVAEEIFEIIN